ncbi:ABC transporter ATP-binding protein [Endobacterium cereale]|uniref:ABC transporter ATP-binding protein n=1 Tax=Endobacterium cereale TaxID=2663029 RepID=UPI002B47CBC0|nr:ABC transporter ATP-binding protein [Endobacterium cereale]MEB2848284.1 ABC transporter ATP-binding protein [Endobacterium cereale]
MASLSLRNVVVDIPIYQPANRSFKNNLLASVTGGQIRPQQGSNNIVIRAIDDMTLDIQHGSRVGLIGHNGAGKSTILRVMAGIYEPTGGTVNVEGEVASMFDIGFGMDPEATGWENIILRGMYLGYSRREIIAASPEIGTLTGLGEFLDMPLRTYSAGMSTRLAFAVSTSIRPDILLVDEGIGAGDAAFIAQAKERMRTFIGSAGILVLASHSNDLIREWCTEGLWLEHGRVRMRGAVDDVLAAYTESVGH